MEKLNLPVIDFKTPTAKKLTMDDYLKFVLLNLRYTCKRPANSELKSRRAVKAPFEIKD